VVTRAVRLLESRLRAEGKDAVFEAFRRYELEAERRESSYADLGRELGLSPAQMRHGLMYARAALREIVTAEVRDYVDGPDDLARELRNLFWG
jgi:hypothetical protein